MSNKLEKRHKICENPECKKEFRARHDGQMYCSNKCRKQSKRKYTEEVECLQCGEMFFPSTLKQKYCSARCSKLSIRREIKIFSYLRDNNIL